MGLAVGAGYVLGRTKKMKLAFAVGTMVAGKRMNLLCRFRISCPAPAPPRGLPRSWKKVLISPDEIQFKQPELEI